MSDPKFTALMAKLQRNPLWFGPRGWTWTTPDGQVQTLENIARQLPGMANLLWLSLPLERPAEYDARNNSVYMWVLAIGGTSHNVKRWPAGTWEQLAEGLTLEEFIALPVPPAGSTADHLQRLALIKETHAKAKTHT